MSVIYLVIYFDSIVTKGLNSYAKMKFKNSEVKLTHKINLNSTP